MSNGLGWIKDHRKTENNPIVTKDNDHFRVWYYLLHHASSKVVDGLFKKEKILIQPGQFLTGRDKISRDCKVEKHKVDRILKCFENDKQIEQQTSTKGRLITIINWNKYQKNEKPFKKQVRNEWETNEKQVSTNKKEKEYKSIRIKEIEREYTAPTLEDVKNFCLDNDLQDFDYEKFFDYYEGTGWIDKNGNSVKNWKAKLRYWCKREQKEKTNLGDKKEYDTKTIFYEEGYGHYKLDEYGRRVVC